MNREEGGENKGMVKFSVGITDDGEGSSNRVPKRQRFNFLDLEFTEEIDPEEVEEDEEDEEDEEVEEDEEGEEEDDDDGDEELEIEEIGAQQEATNPETDRSGSLSFTLTDTEVLDCAICYEPLTVPVFQCENGHIACSTCCIKIRHKCPSCATPIGYSRCRAIEKVLDSVKVSCQNSKYGCKEAFSYSMKQKHENLCFYAPCSCPLSTCYFEGSSNRLSKHFTDKHKCSATPFQYDTLQQLTLGVYDKFIILREEREGSLFILHNKIETLGNIISLSRIGPSVESGYFYDLAAKGHDDGCTLKLQSFTKSTPKRVDGPHSLGFLLVPNLLSCINKQIKIDLQIWRRSNTPYNIKRPLGV